MAAAAGAARGGPPELRQLSDDDAVVLDVAFNLHGTRLVACRADYSVQVWDCGDDGEWRKAAWGNITGAHSDRVLRATWAHPEFGQVFATCCADKQVRIWEEHERAPGERKALCNWQLKAQLSESKRAVTDVKFAPRHLGLRLAAGSRDGLCRLYDANDVVSLNYWPLQETIFADASSTGVTCVAWNPSPFEPAMLLIGGGDGATVWAMADHGGRRWATRRKLVADGAVYDAAWAPCVGRSVHVLATVEESQYVRVHLLQRSSDAALEYARVFMDEPSSQRQELANPQSLEHGERVWRVSWNAAGTALVTSDEQGTAVVWRQHGMGRWLRVQVFAPGHEAPHATYAVP